MIEVNENNFEKELSSGNVILDCFAPWCGPCKALGNILEQVEKDFPNIKFCKCNVDENSTVAEKFGVRNVPVVIMMSDGQVKNMFNGIRPANAIKEMIEEFFSIIF